MSNSITVSEKKEFINWFLNRYELQKKEAAWLLSYLSSDEQLLERIHFVDHVEHLPKVIVMSTTCTEEPSFQFKKKKRKGSDVESAYYDIKLFPNEEIYIDLYFKDRTSCPEFAAVLEVNPMEQQDLVQDSLLGLFAELLLDQAVMKYQKQELYRKIDQALETRDVVAFETWTAELRKLEDKS